MDGTEDLKMHRIAGQIETETSLLVKAVDGKGVTIDEDYADKVIRSQLEELGELVETMSKEVGSGEAISITSPSDLEETPEHEAEEK